MNTLRREFLSVFLPLLALTRNSFLPLSFGLLLSACSHQSISPTIPAKLSISAAERAQILMRQNKRMQISGMGNISWVGRGENVAAAGVLLAEWPDKLRLEIQDPLGGVLGLFILNEERFWWESSKDKRVFTGSSKSAHLAKILPFQIPPKIFVQAILGRPDPSACVDWNSGSQEYSDWQWSKDIHVLIENYAVRSGEQFPESIRVIHNSARGEPAKLSWHWQDWNPSLPKREQNFQIPDDLSRPEMKIEKIF